MRAVIVEDEKNSQELLKELISQYCDPVKVVSVAGSVSEALEMIRLHEPELVFLDIQLPDGDGFQILEQLEDKELSFDIIFTTAYDQYAMRAFKFAAADYLLKPIDIEELQLAVKKVSNKNGNEALDSSQIQTLISNIRNIEQPFKRIILPTSNGFTVVDPVNIIRCESDRNYTFIFLNDGRKILVSRTIKEYEEMLVDFNFFRIHQSHLINLAYLKNYTRGRGGYVELTDGTTLDVSARRKSEFLKRMSLDS